MSRPFKIGDVCEIISFHNPEFNDGYTGMECTVRSGLFPTGSVHVHFNGGIASNTKPVLLCILSDGRNAYLSPVRLRLKKPPPDVASWDEIEKLTRWNPMKIGEPA